jgi:hypothetical protein
VESRSETSVVIFFNAGFLLGLFFGPEDGLYIVLRNVSLPSTYYNGIIFQKKELFRITYFGKIVSSLSADHYLNSSVS